MDEFRRIDLNLLLALRVLLAERHVSRAALRLHKSQPAVSHALAQLREAFGDPLLVRDGRYMSLTPRARELQQPLEIVLGQLSALLQHKTFDPAQALRSFRLALSDYAAHLLLPALMQRLRREAPGIRLAISQNSREAMLAQLADGEIDLALGVFPGAPKEIMLDALFEEHFLCAADKASLPRQGALSLDEWLARPHVSVAVRADALDEIDACLAKDGLSRQVVLVLPHWKTSVEVLPGTDLILTVASRTLQGVLLSRGLKVFAPPVELPRSRPITGSETSCRTARRICRKRSPAQIERGLVVVR